MPSPLEISFPSELVALNQNCWYSTVTLTFVIEQRRSGVGKKRGSQGAKQENIQV